MYTHTHTHTHTPLSLVGMEGAVNLRQLHLQSLDLRLGKVLLEGGLVLCSGVAGEAGQSLRALEEQVFLLDGLAEGHPPSLQLRAEGLGIADGALEHGDLCTCQQ